MRNVIWPTYGFGTPVAQIGRPFAQNLLGKLHEQKQWPITVLEIHFEDADAVRHLNQVRERVQAKSPPSLQARKGLIKGFSGRGDFKRGFT